MKKIFLSAFLIILVSIAFLGTASAGEIKKTSDAKKADETKKTSEAPKIRVLLTTGGHALDTKAFYALFDAMSDVVYVKAELPQAFGLLKPGLEKEYDVLVRYDMVAKNDKAEKISEEQEHAFIELLKTGIGLVSLHHNVGAHYDWPEYRKIIGGKWLSEETEFDGRKYPKSTFLHDQKMKITVVDKDHPITKGVRNFTIYDEVYGGLYISPQLHVLLTTEHPQNSHQVAWVTRYGMSPVAYLQLGHDAKAYTNPNYARLVHNAICWAAARKKQLAEQKLPAKK